MIVYNYNYDLSTYRLIVKIMISYTLCNVRSSITHCVCLEYIPLNVSIQLGRWSMGQGSYIIIIINFYIGVQYEGNTCW